MKPHLIVALLVAGCVASAAAGASSLAVLEVRASPGAAMDSFDGLVEAERQTTISAQVQGQVVSLTVKPGDLVKAGQALLRLDGRSAASGVDASQAQLNAAKAQAGVAARDFERQQALFERHYISQAALERSRAAMEASRSQVSALDAQSNASKSQLGFFVLTAPYAGIVSEVPVSLGDMAAPGRPLLTLFDPQSLRITSHIPESVAQTLGSRPKVQIQLTGTAVTPSVWSVERTQFLPALDAATHTRELRVFLDAAQMAALLPGRYVKVRLQTGASASVTSTILIPRTAVVQRSELQAVYVVDEGQRPILRQVRLGPVAGEQVEVLSGLRAGERIAADPQAAAQVR